MKDSLYHLNEHLFALYEKLSDEDLTGDDLESWMKRADKLNDTAANIISNASLVLKAELTVANSVAEVAMPRMIAAPKNHLPTLEAGVENGGKRG